MDPFLVSRETDSFGFFQYQDKATYYTPYDDVVGTVLTVDFKVRKVSNTSIISYNVQDAYARIGSILAAVVITGKIFMFFINEKLFNSNMITEMLYFEDGIFVDKSKSLRGGS